MTELLELPNRETTFDRARHIASTTNEDVVVTKRPPGPGLHRIPVYTVRADGSVEERAATPLKVPCLLRVHDQFTNLLELHANGVPAWRPGKQKDKHLTNTNRVARLIDMTDTLVKEGLVKTA